MSPYALIPLLLGCLAVLQGVLNRKIAAQWGLAHAVVLSASTLVVASIGFALFVRTWPTLFPPEFRGNVDIRAWKWWFIIPGCCGFFVVSGVPWTLSKVGALQVFVGIVAAQIIASAAWDAVFEGIPLSTTRVLGGLLAVAAVLLVSWRV